MTKSKQHDFQIDAVITWVDGSDIAHQQKMEPYLKGGKSWTNKNFRTRFDQVDEIEFAVRSIIKNAPFVKNIFIVTDEQTPSFLNDFNKKKKTEHPHIEIIDHKIIFAGYESYLPTFNSLPIETLLYKIPNLSEHFIYFNDDLFLMKETKISDFFINGLPVVRGKCTPFDENIFYKVFHQKMMKLLGKPAKDRKYGYKRGQQKIAKALGFDKYFRLDHTVSAFRKSTFKKYFDENPEVITQNIKHKFRHPEQYLVQSLANYIEIKNESCTMKNDYQLVYFGSYKKPLLWYKLQLFLNGRNTNKLFLNMQSLDLCPEHKLKFILGWLNERFTIIQ